MCHVQSSWKWMLYKKNETVQFFALWSGCITRDTKHIMLESKHLMVASTHPLLCNIHQYRIHNTFCPMHCAKGQCNSFIAILGIAILCRAILCIAILCIAKKYKRHMHAASTNAIVHPFYDIMRRPNSAIQIWSLFTQDKMDVLFVLLNHTVHAVQNCWKQKTYHNWHA